MSEQAKPSELLALTSNIVAAHVSNNAVNVADLPHLIREVHDTLSVVGSGAAGREAARPTPAVPVKKSVTPDFIVCLEDGKKLKMLKRHLKTAYNLSPEEYRERWGPVGGLPHGGPELRQAAQQAGQANWIGHEISAR